MDKISELVKGCEFGSHGIHHYLADGEAVPASVISRYVELVDELLAELKNQSVQETSEGVQK